MSEERVEIKDKTDIKEVEKENSDSEPKPGAEYVYISGNELYDSYAQACIYGNHKEFGAFSGAWSATKYDGRHTINKVNLHTREVVKTWRWQIAGTMGPYYEKYYSYKVDEGQSDSDSEYRGNEEKNSE